MLVPKWVVGATIAVFALAVLVALAGSGNRYHLVASNDQYGAKAWRIDRLTGTVSIFVHTSGKVVCRSE